MNVIEIGTVAGMRSALDRLRRDRPPVLGWLRETLASAERTSR